MAEATITQERKTAWHAIVAVLIILPVMVFITQTYLDDMSEAMAERHHDIMVGQCIDMSPAPQGHAMDIVEESGQVKVLQTEKNGHQIVSFLNFNTAYSLIVPCEAQTERE